MRSHTVCHTILRTIALSLTAALTLVFTPGCESSNHDDEEEAAAESQQATQESGEQKDKEKSNSSESSLFPDGLHPNSAGAKKIASAFASVIGKGTTGGETNAVPPIVCLGDSITAGSYPGILAGITGREVINAGKGGEKSSGGAGRVAGLLSTHQPSHLCILYGINDLIAGKSPGEVVGNLRSIVAAANSAGVVPIVGTLTPVFGRYGHLQPEVDKLNSSIRGMGAKVANVAGAF